MKKLKKLTLNKIDVANLSKDEQEQLKGGGWSAGCTDGCTPLQTHGNCTNANCTADCDYGSYYTKSCNVCY